MARPVRVEFQGALYHVINRGNYRYDVFASSSTARAFELVLRDARERFGWKLHAYAIMRNHFHLALETPDANLVAGMHWLQSTFATRFNRFRSERGHLFQGRYQALLVEDAAALARVVNYIHLNPVRARIVPPEQLASFRWSSLSQFVKPSPEPWLEPELWMDQLGFPLTSEGWEAYVASLVRISADAQEQERLGFPQMCRGWAIGSPGWRRAIAEDHAHMALSPGLLADELRKLRHAAWSNKLNELLVQAGKQPEDAAREPRRASWKVAVARELREKAAAPHPWIAEKLAMGSANSVRVYLCRLEQPRLEMVGQAPSTFGAPPSNAS